MRGRSRGQLKGRAQLSPENYFPSETRFSYTQSENEKLRWMRLRQTVNSCSRRFPATSPTHGCAHTWTTHTPHSSTPEEAVVQHHSTDQEHSLQLLCSLPAPPPHSVLRPRSQNHRCLGPDPGEPTVPALSFYFQL